jgi:hypothetical protein
MPTQPSWASAFQADATRSITLSQMVSQGLGADFRLQNENIGLVSGEGEKESGNCSSFYLRPF